LRREIPDGDPGAIFDRAASLLLERIEKTKLGAALKPGRPRPIRSGTDSIHKRASRHIPQAVKRAVWARDRGQCAFASADGRRCTERTFLEYHHLELYARGGPPTVENIALRCSRHNHYEGELIFGPRRTSTARKRRPPSTIEALGP
jgi:5-methylcytosine-specific restriction endonuclease McrA